MARPIVFHPTNVDPRVELQSRLETAPAEHTEAILAAYEVLQGLHDRGLLELLRGALGSGDRLLEIAVAAGESSGSIHATRNLLLLTKMLGAIDPEDLQIFTQTVPPALRAAARRSEHAGFWKLLMGFRKKDVRRGMGAVQALLETLGQTLAAKQGTHREPARTRGTTNSQ